MKEERAAEFLAPEWRTNMASVSRGWRLRPRKRIDPTDTVPLNLTHRERSLIVEYTFAPDYLTNRLRPGPVAVGEQRAGVAFSLDEWEELHGYVAAEANHSRERKLERELHRLCERIQEILDTYTDQD